MSQRGQHLVLMALVAGAVLFTNLGSTKLWDRDEPRNAGCAREMLERQDWVTPVFNAELRIQKPVLLYWLIMTAYSLFGVNEFAARFSSASLGLGTLVCTYLMGRRLFSARVAFWACIILGTTIMFDVASRAATPDAPLIFCVTLAITLYVLGTFQPREHGAAPLELKTPGHYFPQQTGWVVGIYAAMGLGVLAKGPVALILPTAVIGMFLLLVRLSPRVSLDAGAPLTRRWFHTVTGMLRPFAPVHFFRTCWAMRPLTAIGLTLAIAAPWYIWVGLRTDGQWPLAFFLTENISRATTSMENHGGSFMYYPLALLVGFFPWSVFAGPVISELILRLRRGNENRHALQLLVCWVIVWVTAFTVAKTKLPSYVTPTYPAIALLVSFAIGQAIQQNSLTSRWWWRAAFASAVLVGIGITAAIPLATADIFPGEHWLGILGLFPLIAGAMALVLYEYQQRQSALRTYAAGAFLFCLFLFGYALCRVDQHQRADQLLTTTDGYEAGLRVGAYGCLEPTWVFYGGHPIEELQLESHAQVTTRRKPQGTFKTSESLAEFFDSPAPRLLVTTEDHYRDIASRLPEQVVILGDAPYFLRGKQLLLIGRETDHLTAGHQPTTTLR
ncbi:MAG TPA: hypothetical protein DCY79_04275 [Planctomycetaceae bacterium]|nr:hypothetical protein [Blastopirellula sp.]HAY79002.1 hypothetical protein [Planctomycetaceae bacterium]